MYQHLDALLLRAPAWDGRALGLPWPVLSGPAATPEAWRRWLEVAWRVPELATAVEAASPALARQVNRILSDSAVPAASVRRAVLSVLRYLLRGTGRATPFGLLAGVAAAGTGPQAAVRTGSAHEAVARPDATWLSGLAGALESDEGLRLGLTVVASDLIAERDGYLVISRQPGGPDGGPPRRVRARATRPALAALGAARSPVLVAGLTAKLAADFPAAAGTSISRLIAALIEQRFLLTSLRAPMTSADPLGVLLSALDGTAGAGESTASSARAARAALTAEPAGRADAAAERQRADALMRGMHAVSGPALAVDLRLDWDLTVPEAVTAEAAAAAGVLARLARRPALSAGWAAWHARFLDRYGPGGLVPVLDAVDDATGLGFPAGYLGSPHAEQPSPLTSRDKALLAIAHRAAVGGDQQVTLDDALISDLSGLTPGSPVQPSTELTVRIHAASIPDLDDGRFTLHVMGVSRAAGTVAGRFLHLLDPASRQRMLLAYAALPGVHRGSLLAHLSAAPLYARSGNVTRAPQVPGLLITLGEYRADNAGRVPVSDLAVTADASRLHLVSLSRRAPVHTLMPSAVDLTVHTHPLARFLLEAPVALAAPCTAFDWGAASALPFVPALRYGKAVLSPARWTLTAVDLPATRDAGLRGWAGALAAWAGRSGLPRHVRAGDGDRCLPLDLAEPSHRALLHAELGRAGKVRLVAAPEPGDLGWAGQRPHEVTIPLAVPAPAVPPVRWHGEVTRRGHGHLPGRDGRLYLKLYAPRDLQDAILTRHLPALTGRLGDRARWWFIRYDDPAAHLRIRIASDAGSGAIASDWTSELRDLGLLSRVSWDTYYPESARFGGSAVMDAAESFFAADSAAAVAQLSAAGTGKPDPAALTAASMVALCAAVTGDEAEAMRWLVQHAMTGSVPPPRDVYDQAVALACTARDGSGVLPEGVTRAWESRRSAALAYRAALEQAAAFSPAGVLPDLLHLHHARVAGPDITAERACLHLARAAALSWLARRTRRPS